MGPADHPGPLVFVDDLDALELLADDRHHLARVLRLRAGDPITVADGRGRWRTARFDEQVEPTGPAIEVPRPAPAIAIGFALVKGDKPELIVQKLTELGIDRILPFRASRSVVQWDEAKAGKAVTRLRLVARAAAMQCHRPDLPVVEEVRAFADLLGEPGVAMADRTGEPPSLDHPTVLVGPEGGWAPEEADAAAPRVRLGGHVLRAETASVTAGALLAAIRGGLLGQGPPTG